jgi:hypothetical protein
MHHSLRIPIRGSRDFREASPYSASSRPLRGSSASWPRMMAVVAPMSYIRRLRICRELKLKFMVTLLTPSMNRDKFASFDAVRQW